MTYEALKVCYADTFKPRGQEQHVRTIVEVWWFITSRKEGLSGGNRNNSRLEETG